jgi:hypothetical protein
LNCKELIVNFKIVNYNCQLQFISLQLIAT